ncbi:MAG: TetR/AcrR family transcriptional regulator [Deltaproteobacteria bacterium]|jgi:AcrR family transcriptional regulator|nr:TetR/AcrR family transcriptional regulator [Deltaproteobacteria bacterium]
MSQNYSGAGRPAGRPKASSGPSLRDTIMDMTILVLSEKGILASTMAEISQRAQITPATLYYHFSSREKLIEATLEQHLMPLVSYVWSAVRSSDGPLAMLEELQRRMLEVATAYTWYLPLWSRELASESGTLREYLTSKIDEDLRAEFVEKTLQGQREGTLNPLLVPELLFSSIIGTVYIPLLSKKNWEKVHRTEISQERTLQHIQTLLTGGLINHQGKTDE